MKIQRVMTWVLLVLTLGSAMAQPLPPGTYRNLKPTHPLVLDTGSYTFIGCTFTPLSHGEGPGVRLDGRKARSLTLLHCTFEGKGSGTAVLSSGDLTVDHCTFKNMKTGIRSATQAGTTQTLTLTGNTFADNRTAILLENEDPASSSPLTVNFTLKCNEFINTPQTTTSFTRKGLVIGEGVQLRAPNNGGNIDNSIGGNSQFNTNGDAYPNANVWPVDPGVDRTVRPKIGTIEQDLHNPTTGWTNSPNWVAIEDQNPIIPNVYEGITYWRYDNEFVGWGVAIAGTIDLSVPVPKRKLRTYAQTQLDPSDPNYVDPLDDTYDEACGTSFDEQPVLFPARIAVVDSSATFTAIKVANLESMMLGDAVPNPAAHETRIGILLPGSVQQAVLQFVDLGTGKVLQTIPVAERGKLEAILDLHGAKSGVYGYRLIVDGKPIGTRKLVVVK